MSRPNTIQIYYRDKHKSQIEALKDKAKELDESDSKLFLDLILIGAKEKFPEVAHGSCEEAGRNESGSQSRQSCEARVQEEKVIRPERAGTLPA
jgi:hypothetical protein